MKNSASIAHSQIQRLIGKTVKSIACDDDERLTVTFSDTTTLVIGVHTGKLTAKVDHDVVHDAVDAPTKRQRDYLLFIVKYIKRYGRAPAESDIEKHFLVSAPSVNQMMQTLERRGFISRQPGVPRSIKIRIDLDLFGLD
jgi:hypothetical protein